MESLAGCAETAQSTKICAGLGTVRSALPDLNSTVSKGAAGASPALQTKGGGSPEAAAMAIIVMFARFGVTVVLPEPA